MYHDDDGATVIQARLPAEEGALVVKALEAAMDAAWRAGRADTAGAEIPANDLAAEMSASAQGSAEPPEPFTARRADALALLAETYLATGPKSLSGGERYEIIVHVDRDVLARGGEGRCELEEGPWFAAESARRLACDASVVQMLDDADGEPLNVGRRTRSISPALRRALKARDKGCRFPGCTRKRFVEAPRIALGAGWRDESRESGVAMSPPSSPRARGRLRCAASR